MTALEKSKSIEVGIGNISILFGMAKKGVAFGGTLNLKVTKGYDLKPPKKVRAPKVRGEILILEEKEMVVLILKLEEMPKWKDQKLEERLM